MSAGQRGPKNHHWKGGRWYVGGYVAVPIPPDHRFADMAPHGYVYEHRLVLAEHLGRSLAPGDVVHHRNGVTDDNRFENLEFFESNAANTSHHGKLRRDAYLNASSLDPIRRTLDWLSGTQTDVSKAS